MNLNRASWKEKKNYTCLMYLLKEKFKVISLKREQIIIFYLIRMRKDIIKELRGNKYWWECGPRGLLLDCWLEYKVAHCGYHWEGSGQSWKWTSTWLYYTTPEHTLRGEYTFPQRYLLIHVLWCCIHKS